MTLIDAQTCHVVVEHIESVSKIKSFRKNSKTGGEFTITLVSGNTHPMSYDDIRDADKNFQCIMHEISKAQFPSTPVAL